MKHYLFDAGAFMILIKKALVQATVNAVFLIIVIQLQESKNSACTFS